MKKVSKVKKWSAIIIAVLIGIALNLGLMDDSMRSRAVQLIGERGLCSGEQVRAPSGVDYILTAAHCKGLQKEGNILVKTQSDHLVLRRVIAEDPESDLLLIEGLPNLKGISIADDVHLGERVRTLTHGGGLPLYETRGQLISDLEIDVGIGEILSEEDETACTKMSKYKVFDEGFLKECVMHVVETVTTASVIPGSSGGMVLNMRDELVGVVSAGDNFTHMGYLVTLKDIHKFLAGY